jgi:glycosyl transferase family 25
MILVHCISLPDQHDRRAFMQRQFEQLGVSFRFFDAIRVNLNDGWPALYARQERLAQSGVDLRAGEMGCYLSHRGVWSEFLAGAEEVCLVLEDDVGLKPDFVAVVEALCAAPQQWQFVRLFAMFPKPAFPVMRLTGDHVLVDYLAQPNGTQGYLINRAAARCLLNYTESMSAAIDTTLDRDWDHGVEIRGVEPAVLSHDEAFETTLGPADKARLTPGQKFMREWHRIGPNLRKKVWRAKKSRRLRSVRVD